MLGKKVLSAIILVLLMVIAILAESPSEWSANVYWGRDQGAKVLFFSRDLRDTAIDTSTFIKAKNSQILIDSAGTEIRIDNTADSCSLPFNMHQGAQLSPNPAVWKKIFHGSVLSSQTSGQNIKFSLESRRIRYSTTGARGPYWTPWVKEGDQDMTGAGCTGLVDTLLTKDVAAADTEETQEIAVYKDGVQGRLCPSISGTVGASDSIVIDDIMMVFQ